MIARAVDNPILEAHDLTVSYNRRPVLWNVDLMLPAGVMAGVIGPNGAGKSTFLKAVLGLVPLDSGYVSLWKQPLDAVRRRVSYVPQRASVDWDFPASAYDVVLMGTYGRLGLFRRPGRAEKERARACLAQVGLSEFADRQISQLSGGQQQRVFLARALAQDADFYILDEPFAGVDMATEASIIQLLRQLKANGKTILCVHHDLRSAPDYFDWIIMLNQRLVANGPTSEAFMDAQLQETYGGRLNILTDVGQLMERSGIARK